MKFQGISYIISTSLCIICIILTHTYFKHILSSQERCLTHSVLFTWSVKLLIWTPCITKDRNIWPDFNEIMYCICLIATFQSDHYRLIDLVPIYKYFKWSTLKVFQVIANAWEVFITILLKLGRYNLHYILLKPYIKETKCAV